MYGWYIRRERDLGIKILRLLLRVSFEAPFPNRQGYTGIVGMPWSSFHWRRRIQFFSLLWLTGLYPHTRWHHATSLITEMALLDFIPQIFIEQLLDSLLCHTLVHSHLVQALQLCISSTATGDVVVFILLCGMLELGSNMWQTRVSPPTTAKLQLCSPGRIPLVTTTNRAAEGCRHGGNKNEKMLIIPCLKTQTKSQC